MRKTGRFLIIFLMGFTLNSLYIFSQVTLSVSLSDERIGIDEPFTIKVNIEGGAGSVTFRDLPDNFRLRSTSQSRDIKIVNFSTVSSQTYYYTYTASKEGVYTIRGIEAKVKNTVYKAKAVTIEVVRESVRVPKRSKEDTLVVNDEDLREMFRDEIYVKNTVSKKDAYINEPIYIQQTLFTRIPLRVLGVANTPNRSDFYAVANTNEYQQTREVINGNDFNVKLIKEEVIYALKPGTKTINTTSFVFQKTANIFSEQIEKGSDTFSVNIIPLPQAPKDIVFSGAVGDYFSIDTEVSHTNVAVSDTIVLRVTVQGNGNPSVIKMPSIDKDSVESMFTLYSPKTYENHYFGNGAMNSKKIDEYVLVARESGVYELDRLSLSYFSPKEKAYKTIYSDKLTLNISKTASSSTAVYNNNENEEKITTIRNTELKISQSHNVFTDIYVRIYMIFILLSTIIAVIAVSIKRDKIQSKEKIKKMDDLFVEAEKYYTSGERVLYAKEFYRIFLSVLSKNLKISENASVSEIINAMNNTKIKAEIVKQISDILEKCNYEIYGGFVDNENTNYHAKVAKILEDLKWVYKL